MSIREALQADLSLATGVPGVLVEMALRIAAELDLEPSPQDVAKLSAELRQVLERIKRESRPQTTELDEVLSRVKATEFG